MWDMSYVNNVASAVANFDLRIFAYISYRLSWIRMRQITRERQRTPLYACETCPLGALPCLHRDLVESHTLEQQCVGGSHTHRVTLGLGTSFSRLVFKRYIRKWIKKSSGEASRNLLLLCFGVCSLASLFVVSIRTNRLSLHVFATGEYR